MKASTRRPAPRARVAILAISLVLALSGGPGVPGRAAAQRRHRAQSGELKEAAALNDRVVALLGEGRYSEALPLAERALAIREKALGPESSSTADSLNNLAVLYRAQGQYEKAEPLSTRALAIYEKALGPEHASTANSLNNLAELYRLQGQYAKAEPLYARALAINEKTLGPEHRATATSLTGLAALYYYQGQYAKAEPLYQRALAINEKALGPEHPETAHSLNNLALLYFSQGQYAKAEPLYQRALAINEKALGSEHPETAYALNNLAALYESQGRYEKAESSLTRALAIDEKALGPEHPYTAAALANLAAVYRSQGQYAKAESLFSRALAINEKALGSDHPSTADSLNNLAVLYYTQGQYAKAEPLYQRALAIREKTSGADHPSTAAALANLAALYQSQGLYRKAEPLLVRALAIDEKALGPDHPTTSTALDGLAELYQRMGQFTKAEPLYARALAIDEKALGSEHPDTATRLNDLARLYREQGQYAKAEPLYQRALAIDEKALGPEHSDTSSTLNELANLYREQGQYAKAEPLFVRALAIVEKVFGLEHPDAAAELNNLGELYIRQGQYPKAELPLARALAIYEKAFGPEHPDTANALNNLAVLYKRERQYGKAEPLYLRALAIAEKVFGPEHPTTAMELNNLAELYRIQGQYARAEPLYLRALAVDERALGPEHHHTVGELDSLSDLYRAAGRYERAIDCEVRADDARERDLVRNLAAGSQDQKLRYLELSEHDLDRTISLHIESAPDDLRARRAALEIVLRRKGRALDAMTDAVEALRRRASSDDLALLDDLTAAQAELSRRSLAGQGAEDVAAHRGELKLLEQRVDELEGRVSGRSAEFRAAATPVTLEGVQRLVPKGVVLVEFVSYLPYDAETQEYGERRYAVYTLGATGEPGWADLGKAKRVETAIDAFRALLRSPESDEEEVRERAHALDKLVMRPVLRLAGSSRRLLLVPDGALNLVPFAALVDKHDRYLVETYTLSYLTSGRDLLRLAASEPSVRSPLVVADPDFGPRPGASGSRMLKVEGGGGGGVDLSRVYFAPLAGTAEEAEAIRATVPGATVLTGRRATESALKSAHAPSILHVATHGFFLDEAVVGPPPSGEEARLLVHTAVGGDGSLDDVGGDRTTRARLENPLLRSGLGLSGANTRQGGDDNDGILTALEATGLDLWGTQLVVLSACDTGVGEVKTGDGIYGLRRALVLAGAESQMVSLWPVSDAGTRDLMIGYYKGLVAGKGRTEALREVQLRMLRDAKRSHPYYWACFIQSGAWGPVRLEK